MIRTSRPMIWMITAAPAIAVYALFVGRTVIVSPTAPRLISEPHAIARQRRAAAHAPLIGLVRREPQVDQGQRGELEEHGDGGHPREEVVLRLDRDRFANTAATHMKPLVDST